MKHLVVTPTYNEAGNVENIVKTVFGLYPDINILIVDDSSPDGTGNIVRSLQKDFPNLFLLTQEKKAGLAQAYINGFKWGMEKGFELFTSLDADFSHNPKYIADAIKVINDGNDSACASRYIENAHTEEKHWFRNFISIGGNRYINFVLGNELKDWTGGFNTFTKEALEKINLDSINVSGYIFQAQLKYKAINAGCKVKEFPIIFEERKVGQSKMSAFIIAEAFFSVLRMRLEKK